MRNALTHPLLFAALCVALFCPLSGWTAPRIVDRVKAIGKPALDEPSLERVPAHISEFTPVSEPMALPRCGDVRPPEALATPDPLLIVDDSDMHVRVSFIVGSDGRVHSPFILDSGGVRDDQVVLRAVRRWRYRPALCNGVPTDSEARVQFSLR